MAGAGVSARVDRTIRDGAVAACSGAPGGWLLRRVRREPGLRRSSYAVAWREADGCVCAGELSFVRDHLRLDGTSSEDGRLRTRQIPYGDLAAVYIGRGADERLNDRAALVLERHSGAPVQIGALQVGTLGELTDILAALVSGIDESSDLLVVTVPLRKGAGERVRQLIAQGPPFDPSGTGLERHRVLITERDVIFLFEGRNVRETAERLLSDPGVWRAAIEWRGCFAGPPRLADDLYTWTRGA